MDRFTRNAALASAAVAVPVAVALAFVLGGGSGSTSASGSPSPSAPPSVVESTVPDLDQATAAVCGPLLAAMPVDLDGLSPQRVVPGGPSIIAWGNPQVVVHCGVARPTQLQGDIAFNPITIGRDGASSVTWLALPDDPDADGNARPGTRVTWTAIDRSVYIDVVVDSGDTGYLTDLSGVIAAQLPPVCQATPQSGDPAGTVYCGDRP